jgi:short-subunit dehydrogenase
MKKILITGASDGIGLATAKLLAAEGATLTLVARHEHKLQAAARALPGGPHQYLVADLATNEGVALVTQLIEAEPFDVFLNNAGVGLYGPLATLPLAEQLRMMRLNMDAVTVLAYHYLLRARPGDALVNTGSFVGFTSMPGAAVYAATKAFVASLSESLWWEYKSEGVYVLGFNPGSVANNFHANAGGTPDTFPASNRQTTEAVARELVQALRRRAKPRVVAGALNRLILFGQRWLPRAVAVNIMGGLGPANGKFVPAARPAAPTQSIH